jgi:hypothetical protein
VMATMKTKAPFERSRMYSGILLTLLLFSALGCTATAPLTEVERQKLDPLLTTLLRDEKVPESDYDTGLRKDGAREYAVIIRSKNVDEIRQAGIQVGSAFDDVITARVTIQELRKILSLSSVRAVQASTKNRPQ